MECGKSPHFECPLRVVFLPMIYALLDVIACEAKKSNLMRSCGPHTSRVVRVRIQFPIGIFFPSTVNTSLISKNMIRNARLLGITMGLSSSIIG